MTLIADVNFDKDNTDILSVSEYNDLMMLLDRLTEASVYIKRTIYIKDDEEYLPDDLEINTPADKKDKFTYKELHTLIDLLSKLTCPVLCIRRPIQLVDD